MAMRRRPRTDLREDPPFRVSEGEPNYYTGGQSRFGEGSGVQLAGDDIVEGSVPYNERDSGFLGLGQRDVTAAYGQIPGFGLGENVRLSGIGQNITEAGQVGREDAHAQGQEGLGWGYDQGKQFTERGQEMNTQAGMRGDDFQNLGASINKDASGEAGHLQGLGEDMAGRGGPEDIQALRNFYGQGPGPSAAEAQMRLGADQNMAQSIALARSGRGGANPAAMRQAMSGNAATGAQTNAQLGNLRAQEAANWRGQQMQAMGMAGGMELQQGGMNDAAMANFYNLAAGERARGTQAELGFGGLAGQQYGQGQQAEIGMAGMGNQAVGMGQNYNLGMTGQGNEYALGMAGQGLGYEQLGSNILSNELNAATNAGIANQAADANFFDNMFSDVSMKTDIEPYVIDLSSAADVGGGGGGGGGSFLDAIFSDRDTKERLQRTEAELDLSLDKLRAMGGATMPDVRSPNTAALDAVAAAPGYRFRYKPEAQEDFGLSGREHYGPMAQDLERTPVGRSVVRDGPGGKKVVDAAKLTMVNTAATGELARKQEELERQLEALRRMAGEATAYQRTPTAYPTMR